MVQATETADLEALKKDFNDELGKTFDKRNGELLEQLQKRIDDAINAQNAELTKRFATFSLPGAETEKHKGKKFSFARAMAGVASGDYSVCPMEREMHDAIKAKAMSFGTDTAGGFLVPNEVLVSELIPLLYAESVAMTLGATSLNGLTRAPIQIPRVNGGTTAYWVAEASAITPSDAALQQLQLSPRGLAALTVISDLLQILDNTGVEAMLRQDMARQLALKLDLAIMKGTGGTQPQGIIGYTGVNTATLTDPTTYDELLAFVSEVRNDNALMGRLGWAVSNADMLEMEQMKDAVGADNKASVQTLGSRMLLSGSAADRRLLEYPVKVSTQLADGNVIFGNWADVIIAQWGGMRLDMTNAVSFTSAQSHIRALTYVDVGLRHPQSFCVPA